MTIGIDDLTGSSIGRTVSSLKKVDNELVAKLAKHLVKKWKTLVKEEEASGGAAPAGAAAPEAPAAPADDAGGAAPADDAAAPAEPAPDAAEAAAPAEEPAEEPAEAVSYTHLTLPTILLV